MERKRNTCETVKSLLDFGVSATGVAGRKRMCKVCYSKKSKEYRIKHKEVLSVRRRARYLKNHDKEKSDNNKWKKENPDKRSFTDAKRRAAKLQRTVAWADTDKIREIYKDCIEINLAAKAAGCAEMFWVDHVVPLQGELVSGLHVEYNLDIITASENLKKSNKFIPR